MPYEEAQKAYQGNRTTHYYKEALQKSKSFREGYKKRKGVIKASEMPWEDSPQGRLKHVINEELNTTECALDMYQQFIRPAGASGKHRHMSEEVFLVLEGKGYDLHWDVKFDCEDRFIWEWQDKPKRFDWEEGDFVYIPRTMNPLKVEMQYDLQRHYSLEVKLLKRLGILLFGNGL